MGCFSLLLSACGAEEDRQEPIRSALATLPFELDVNHVLLDLPLQGDGTLAMVLDTGASNTLLNRSTADRLALEFDEGAPSAATGAAGTVNVKVLRNPLTLSLGKVELVVAGAAAMPLDSVSHRVGKRLDGVLGAQLFRRFVVEIAYADEELRLYEPDRYRPRDTAVSVSLVLHQGIPTVQAAVTIPDGRRVEGRFFLDSGAGSTVVLSQAFSDQHRILASVDRRIDASAHGASHAFQHATARIAELAIGGQTIERPLALFPHVARGALADPSIAGVIGGGALKRFTLTVDLSRNRILLEKNRNFEEPDLFIKSGMKLSAEGEQFDQYRVYEVIAGSSAAEQGIQPGDELVTVAGRPASRLRLPEIRELLGQEGQPVRVELRRGDEEITVVLTPRSLL